MSAFISGDNVTAAGLPYRTTVGNAISGSNSTGGKLWLPIWSGEVIHAYDEFNMFEPLVTTRVIPSGTTVEIPVTGTVDLKPSWDAGVELIGGAASTAKTFQLILDKRPMAAHFEIDNIDLMQTQWEFRNELARQAALTLANVRDKQIYSYLVRAAVTTRLSGDPRPTMGYADLEDLVFGDDNDTASSGTRNLGYWGAPSATSATRATGALSALECIEKYIVFLQENNIPYDKLYMAMSPQCFMDIRALGVARGSTDFDDGGRQSYFTGQAGLGGPLTNSYGQLHDTLEYMGCTLVKSNHVGDTMGNVSGGNTLGEDKYNLDFTINQTNTAALKQGVRAVMWTPEAIAGIRLQGLKVDTVDDVRRNTAFTVASMMAGTGVLRPECAAIVHGFGDPETESDGSRNRTAMRASGFLDVDADGYTVA